VSLTTGPNATAIRIIPRIRVRAFAAGGLSRARGSVDARMRVGGGAETSIGAEARMPTSAPGSGLKSGVRRSPASAATGVALASHITRASGLNNP